MYLITFIDNLDGNWITSGTISIERLPQGALERCIIVQDDGARFKLTPSQIQLGDTVKVESTNKMYYVIDTSKLSSEAGYTVYTAGIATEVPWNGVTGKPGTFPPSSHTHKEFDGKVDKGGYSGTAQNLKSDIDGKVSKNGDTMTNGLTIDSTGSYFKGLRNGQVKFHLSANDSSTYIWNEKSKKTLILYDNGNAAYPADNLQTTSKDVVGAVNEVNRGKVSKSGDNMNGTLTLLQRSDTPQLVGVRNNIDNDLNNRGINYEMGMSYTGTEDRNTIQNGFPMKNNANGILTFNTHAGGYVHQIGLSSDGLLYHRCRTSEKFEDWSPLIENKNAWKIIPKIIGNRDTNTDLDTIVQAGFYISGRDENKFTHIPAGMPGAFELTVTGIDPTNLQYTTQILKAHSSNKIFIRTQTAFTSSPDFPNWTEWECLLTDKEAVLKNSLIIKRDTYPEVLFENSATDKNVGAVGYAISENYTYLRTQNGSSLKLYENGNAELRAKNLQTTAKEVVGAINEVNSGKVSKSGGDITGQLNLRTQNKGLSFTYVGNSENPLPPSHPASITGGADYAGFDKMGNISLNSWFGISFCPTIQGQKVPQYTPAAYIDTRTGVMGVKEKIITKDLAASGSLTISQNLVANNSVATKKIILNGWEITIV